MPQKTGRGWAVVAGVVRSTAYGSAYNSTACTDRLPIKSETMTEKIEIVNSDALIGEAGLKDQRLGNKTVGGGIVCEVGYTKKGTDFCGCDMPMAQALGTAYWDTSSKKNIFIPVDDVTESFSLIIDKQVEEAQFHGCMVKSFSIKGETGKPIEAPFDLIAKSYALGTNATTLDSSLDCDSMDRVLFGDFTFRLGDRANILASTDNIGIKDFNFSFNNNLSDAQFSSPDTTEATHTDGRLTRQPVRNGFREVTLEFTLPRYMGTATTDWGLFLEDCKSGGIALQFHASASMPTGTRSFEIKIPNMLIEELNQSADGAGALEQKVKCRCYRGAGVDPSGTGTYVTLDSRGTGSAINEECAIEIANASTGRSTAIW